MRRKKSVLSGCLSRTQYSSSRWIAARISSPSLWTQIFKVPAWVLVFRKGHISCSKTDEKFSGYHTGSSGYARSLGFGRPFNPLPSSSTSHWISMQWKEGWNRLLTLAFIILGETMQDCSSSSLCHLVISSVINPALVQVTPWLGWLSWNRLPISSKFKLG